MMKKRRNIYFILGLVFFASALTISLYNIWDDKRAGKTASKALGVVKESQKLPSDLYWGEDADEYEVPDYQLDPNTKMESQMIDGLSYVGLINIAAIGLELPVLEEWSYPNLKIGPCVYKGTPYKGKFVVMAHNYASHFGTIHDTVIGDSVIFSDMDGNSFVYEVVEKDVLKETQLEDLNAGEWDLTLFTCTLDLTLKSRVVIRCEKTREIPNSSKLEDNRTE